MEDTTFTISVSPLRVYFGYFLFSLPIWTSVFFAFYPVKTNFSRLKFIATSIPLTYLLCIFILFTSFLITPILWGLEGKISDELFIMPTHPKGDFAHAIEMVVNITLLAIAFLLPFKLRSRHVFNR